MRIGIIGNYGAGNLGDEAILCGLTELIREKHPDCQISVLGKGMLFPVGFRSFMRSLFAWNLWKRPLTEIRRCDKVILGGGGLFSDEEKPLTAAFWALQGFCSLWLHKPVYCLGVSFGSIGGISRYLLKRFFKRCSGIVVRDINSQKLLESWGIKCDLGGDLALAIKTMQSNRLHGEKEYVFACLRSYKNLSQDLYTKFVRICDLIITKYGLSIRFIPLVKDQQNDAQLLNKIIDQLANKKMAEVVQYSNDIQDVLATISGAKWGITMRLHGGVFSLITGTPFVPISYSDKVSGFWNDYSLNFLNTHNLDMDDFIKAIETVNFEEKRIKGEIEEIYQQKIALLTKYNKYI